MSKENTLNRVRSFASRWRGTLSITGFALLSELGTRLGLPGVNGQLVHDFIRSAPAGFIRLYDFLAGGGVGRAALLAFGLVPYAQARLYFWAARALSRGARDATRRGATKRGIVRIMTTALATIQAYGFALFVSGIPGAVSDPGPVFVIQTVLVVTGGALVVSMLAEPLLPAMRDDAVDATSEVAAEIAVS